MATIAHLECSRCKTTVSAETPQTLCPKCRGSLYVRYDLRSMHGTAARDDVARKAAESPWLGMWRYRSVLPDVEPVTLGEGWTRYGKKYPMPMKDYRALASAGAAMASVSDVGKLIVALCPGNKSPFPADGLKAAYTTQFPDVKAERTFGIGFILGQKDGKRVIGHSGAVNGCVAELDVLPDDKLGVIGHGFGDQDFASLLELAARGADLELEPDKRFVPDGLGSAP